MPIYGNACGAVSPWSHWPRPWCKTRSNGTRRGRITFAVLLSVARSICITSSKSWNAARCRLKLCCCRLSKAHSIRKPTRVPKPLACGNLFRLRANFSGSSRTGYQTTGVMCCAPPMPRSIICKSCTACSIHGNWRLPPITAAKAVWAVRLRPISARVCRPIS